MSARTDERRFELAKRLQNLPDPQPPFDVQVGWARDYDTLLENHFFETNGAQSILDRALASGRVLVTGHGGGAKSVLMARVARIAATQKLVTVFITMKEWTASDTPAWKELSGPNERMSFLLERFSGTLMLPRDLNGLAPTDFKLILLDGVNEVDSHSGQQVLHALDEYARFSLNTSVIVSDRLVRRDLLRPERWQLALLLPLSRAQVAEIVETNPQAAARFQNASDAERSLLTTPYFLNAFLTGGPLADTIANQMHQYFSQHALSELDITRAAEAAFAVYADSTRTFLWAQFQLIAGNEIAERLVAAGAIVVEGQLAHFDHHLKHDFLASRVLVSDPSRWTSEVFATLTFHASSFETIVMAMEQIANSTLADSLLRSLYDWNLYAAGYSIAEGRASRVSPDMQIVILAMFAERRWDLVTATALRAMDTLRLIDSEDAVIFLRANSLEHVLEAVRQKAGQSSWFPEWKRLFTRQPGERAEEPDVQGLTADDSVIGWTTANVLRRLTLSPDQVDAVRRLIDSSNPTVQWRAVHVLGIHPSEDNRRRLFDCLSSESKNVRFGAIRSLVEMAARGDSELAERVFVEIAKQIKLLTAHSTTLAEFERAIFVQPEKTPPGWTRSVSIALMALQRASVGMAERERWDQTLSKLVNTYGL